MANTYDIRDQLPGLSLLGTSLDLGIYAVIP